MIDIFEENNAMLLLRLDLFFFLSWIVVTWCILTLIVWETKQKGRRWLAFHSIPKNLEKGENQIRND